MSWRLAHLPWLLGANAAVLVGAVLIGWWLRGAAGAAGAAVGVAVVVVSYLVSTLLIAWADRIDPQLVFAVGLGAYLVKFTALGFVMFAVVSSGWPGVDPMRGGVVAGVVAWTTAQIWWVVRHPPTLEYRPPTSPPPADPAAGEPVAAEAAETAEAVAAEPAGPPAGAPTGDRTRR